MAGRRSARTQALVSALILACSAALFSGCSDPRPTASSGTDGGVIGGSKACTLCHGDGARQATTLNPALPAAPPKGSNGEIDVSTRAVGAHQLHLQDGAVRSAVACAECHVVPTTAAHANGKVDLAFGTLATTGGAVPLWNGSSCSASYCHGGFAGGNATNAPVWTQARASSCGTCHGLPPAAPHPDVGTGSSCGSCHTGYTATTVNLATHMDGKVDVANLTCSSCHGDSTRADTTLNPRFSAAPPKGSKGETATTSRAVGAHALHLKDGTSFACTECHVVPTSTSHSNGTAEIAFGTIAATGGTSPAWNGATCSNVYCHGSFTGGNRTYAPTWTSPAATSCGTCHGVPPVAPHSQSTDCGSCHTGYTSTTVNASLHVNGKVDVANLTCSSCHGDATRVATTLNPDLPAAPPKDAKGNTATTARGVGAHQRHLVAGTLSAGTACGECHVVPTSTTHSNGAVEVVFGSLSKTGGVNPAWNGSGCASSYCHGNFKNGTTTYVPSWTAPAASACGTCHGLPPGGTHPANAACATCHAGYTATSVNLTNHLNGVVDVIGLSCTSCHGSAARVERGRSRPEPGCGASGRQRRRDDGRGGRHAPRAREPCCCRRGLQAGGLHRVPHQQRRQHQPLEQRGERDLRDGDGCEPGRLHAHLRAGQRDDDPDHLRHLLPRLLAQRDDDARQRGLLDLERRGRRLRQLPQVASGHGQPPQRRGDHHLHSCHAGTVNAAGAVNVAGGLHVNGAIDTSTLTCTSCHGGTLVATGNQDANVGAAPRGAGAPDTYGNTTVAFNGVGVHASHVLGTRSRPVLCNACHTDRARRSTRPAW